MSREPALTHSSQWESSAFLGGIEFEEGKTLIFSALHIVRHDQTCRDQQVRDRRIIARHIFAAPGTLHASMSRSGLPLVASSQPS